MLLLVNKLLPSRPPLEREIPVIEDLASSMNSYTIDRVTVNCGLYLVYNDTLTKLPLIGNFLVAFHMKMKSHKKCVPPTGSFPCKSNSFPYEMFCTRTCFETEAQDNSEMTYSKITAEKYLPRKQNSEVAKLNHQGSGIT